MNRKSWILCILSTCLLLLGQSCFAQSAAASQATADSLLKKADSLKFISTHEVRRLASKAIEISTELDYEKGKAHGYALNAWVFRMWGFNQKATDHALKAIELGRKGNYVREELEATMQLGLILRDQDIYNSSDSIFAIGLNLARQNQDTLYMAYMLNGQGECARLTGRYDEAYEMYLQVNQWHEQMDNPMGISSSWNNLGLVHLAREEYDQAIFWLNKSLSLGKDLNFMALIMESADGLSRAYLQTDQVDEAEQIALENLQYAQDNRFQKYIAFGYENLTQLYAFKEDWKQAFEYQQRYNELKEELKSEEIERLVAGLRYDQEIVQKESELTNLKEKRRQQRTFLVMVLLGFALVSVMAIFLFRSRMKAKLMNRQLALQFEELQRIQGEKDGLLQIVAHDLRSPLLKIEGLLELLQGSGPLNQQQERSLDFIRQTSRDGRYLIQDLLDIHAAEGQEASAKSESFELVSLLKDLAQSYQARAGQKQLHLVFEGSPQGVECVTDRLAVSRVVDNLLSNAIKYSPPDRRVWLKVWQEGPVAMVEVADEGPGFSAEDRARMFRKFQMLSARPTGGETSNGLGLAIVQALLNRLKGTVELVSAPGNGASFTISFPRKL